MSLKNLIHVLTSPNVVPDATMVEQKRPDTFVGTANGNSQIDSIHAELYVDYGRVQMVRDIRQMDKQDSRVKTIHSRMAKSVVKGGITLRKTTNKRIKREFARYVARLNLNNAQKLQSDARGLVMEGNLAMQWVIDDLLQVAKGVRMPSDTIRPETDKAGQFVPGKPAYSQLDPNTAKVIAAFEAWQMTLARLEPDNYDDMGAMGRPYLDASREVWRKLRMTETDLVVRRHTRAPQKNLHTLEGADEEEMKAYMLRNKAKSGEYNADSVTNKKGGITALQGDANLDQIADVVHLLDTFYTGAPGPRGLFGYADGLQRDVLEDLKIDYFEQIDSLQDTQAGVYQAGFILHLLLAKINPDLDEIDVQFKERRTETPNQATDRALKQQAIGTSRRTVIETAGLEYDEEIKRIELERKNNDPYPDPDNIGAGKVTVTQGNAKKKESATDIKN